MEIPSIFQTKLQHQPGGEEMLIFPGKHVLNYQWRDCRLRWLRTMHIDARTGAIISCGFPKFMALGEGSDEYNIDLGDVLKSKDLIATEKIDGTCLIRYVSNNKVGWRTKQSFHVQLDNEFEIAEFEARYPKLADPEFCSDLTLMFEWVSPFNQIIVKYDKPAITLIGAVKFTQGVPWHEADINLLQIDVLNVISQSCGVPLVEYFSLRSTDKVNELIERTRLAEKEEGYVLRLNKDQQLVKVKSDWWLLAFNCKIAFSTVLAIELWLYWNKPEWNEYYRRFVETFDEEAWTKGLPVVSAMYDGVRKVRGIVEHIQSFCNANSGVQDDEFNRLAAERFNMLRLEACNAIRQNIAVPGHIWKKLILQNSIQMDRPIV